MASAGDKIRSTALRDRLVETAGRVLLQEGYQSLSMRRVAQEAGCSQMAMYRHFANKDALIQHICTQLYTRFSTRMHREIEAASDPWEKLRRLVSALIRFATRYPDHYSLLFLVRHPDPAVTAERERLGQEFIAGLREIVRAVLPVSTTAAVVDMKLRQMLSALHGTAALLISHREAYGLTRQKGIEDAEATTRAILGRRPTAE